MYWAWDGLVLSKVRLRDRVLARCGAMRLDRAIATGAPVEGNRRIAVRALILVAPATRRSLAESWERLLGRSTVQVAAVSARLPIQKDELLAAQPEIRRLIALLRAPRPVSAAGVALASEILTDGAGPVYCPHSATTLDRCLQTALNVLGSSTL
jgi:hypothetical protein